MARCAAATGAVCVIPDFHADCMRAARDGRARCHCAGRGGDCGCWRLHYNGSNGTDG